MAVKMKKTENGLEALTFYCRKCQRVAEESAFPTAVDPFLDSNGRMSICKNCISEMALSFYATELTFERTIHRLCKTLNVRYEPKAVEATLKNINAGVINRKGDVGNWFNAYKIDLVSNSGEGPGKKRAGLMDLTYSEPAREIMSEVMSMGEFSDEEYLKESWGKNLTSDDYEFLEQEFIKWRKTTKCDNQSEEILIRELCHKQNEIRKARLEGKSVSGLVKELQEIMKSSALTPALQNAAQSGKAADTFGNWVKEIESTSPAEWYKDQSKYKDMDGLSEDIADIKRSIGNFITGSRDFNTGDLQDINDSEDLDLEA